MRKTVNCQPGFSLVEIILYIALVSIFILVLTDIFSAILNTKTESEATSAVEQDSRFILARLNYDIYRANSITNPASPGQTSIGTLTIASPSLTYSLSNDNLTLNGTNINSSETIISNLSFKKMGNLGGRETITVMFTITSKTQRPSGPETKTFKTTIGRR